VVPETRPFVLYHPAPDVLVLLENRVVRRWRKKGAVHLKIADRLLIIMVVVVIVQDVDCGRDVLPPLALR
jgi:hypothetical protein